MATSRTALSTLTLPRVVSRREWLHVSALGAAGFFVLQEGLNGQQLPPGIGMAATPPCDPSTRPTPARKPAGFVAGTPQRQKLTEPIDTGQLLLLTGTVAGIRCGNIAGATLEFWAADGKGVRDASMRLRGHQTTDANGGYRIETIVPGAAAGRAARVNVQLTVPKKTGLTTEIFLPEAIAGLANARDKEFDPLLAMTLIDRSALRITASFNLILDL